VSNVKPAERDAEGKCIDFRCTRTGFGGGDMGRCVGMHCPDCDTPVGGQGHKCPLRPEDADTLTLVAIEGDAV